MFEAHAERIPVDPAGRPGRAWLELKGSILIYRRESWVTSASVFIPVEWISVSERWQYDWRHLWRGIIALMTAVLFALPLALFVRMMRPYQPGDFLIGAGLAGFLGLAAATGLWQLSRFPRRKLVTVLSVSGQPFGMEMAFWRTTGTDAALDNVIETMHTGRARIEDELAYPVRMNHMWHRPKPYRIALLKGLAISLCLGMALLLMETLRAVGYPFGYSRWLLALVAAPPLFYVLAENIRRGPLNRRPLAYRIALRAYLRGDLALARECLDTLLREQPLHSEARLLMVQTCAEGYEFDRALEHCERLAVEHPLLASRLQATIWSLRRIHDRMQA